MDNLYEYIGKRFDVLTDWDERGAAQRRGDV